MMLVRHGNECLAWNAVRQDSRSTKWLAVHQHHLGAHLSRHQGRFVATGTTADDDHLITGPGHIGIVPHDAPNIDRDMPTLTGMALYAAYGTNLNPHRMAQRAPASPVFSSGWLVGWRLTFGGADLGFDGALATVVEDPLEQVFVVLYDVPEIDESALDVWEGIESGLWRKIRVRIQAMDRDHLAWLYVLDAYEGGLPSAMYLSDLADAARAGGAPDDYVQAILRHQTG
jgi:hypothetical protein